MSVVKTIARHGNGSALPLDKALLKQLGLNLGDRVQVVVSGGSLVVTPVDRRISNDQFQRSKREVLARYSAMLQRLAKR